MASAWVAGGKGGLKPSKCHTQCMIISIDKARDLRRLRREEPPEQLSDDSESVTQCVCRAFLGHAAHDSTCHATAFRVSRLRTDVRVGCPPRLLESQKASTSN